MTAIRVVVDTSALFPRQQREDLQNLALQGAFTGIWSPPIIGELYRVLTWRAIEAGATPLEGSTGKRAMRCDLSNAVYHRLSLASQRMMDHFLANPHWELVNPRPPYPQAWESLTDDWDLPIWATAVLGQAQYVVSDNTDDYPPPNEQGHYIYGGIEYLSGQDFIARLIGDSD